MSIWDEDGEADDLVGTASLSVYEIPFDKVNDEFTFVSKALNIYGPKGEIVRGFDTISNENDGEPSKINVRARYVAFLGPRDLMDGLVKQASQETH